MSGGGFSIGGSTTVTNSNLLADNKISSVKIYRVKQMVT